MKKYIISLIITLGLCSCSFLEIVPDKSGNATVNTMEQLYQLMGNSSFYNSIYGYTWSENVLFSDDMEFTPYLYEKMTNKTNLYLLSTADRDFLANEPTIVKNGTWGGAYKDMFTFNLVLEQLDNVVQSTPAMKEEVRGEALFNRAYFHFLALVNYCKYDMDAPGLGYRDNTAAAPAGIPARETVGYTVGRIREDLENAEKALTAAGRTEFEQERNFRVTLPALYAFKARFELYLGNYEAALNAADNALKGHDALVDFKNDPAYERKLGKQHDILDADGNPTGETIDCYTLPQLASMFGGETYFLEYEELYIPHACLNTYAFGMIPMSRSLYELYDRENDARWLYFYNNNYVADFSVFYSGGFDIEEQENLKEWNRHVYLRFTIGGNKVYILGPTTAEMYLIRAECRARAGETDKAKEDLVTLRKTRFMNDAAAENISGSVEDVINERRREFAGVLRFYDLKRLNFKENANISYTKQVHSDIYNLESDIVDVHFTPDQDFYTFPIPETERVLMGW